jgi:hypothetical protein
MTGTGELNENNEQAADMILPYQQPALAREKEQIH